MKLTRVKQIIELCIELWTWLAKTGKVKSEWPRWKEFTGILSRKHLASHAFCWLCYIDNHKLNGKDREIHTPCTVCPYNKKYGHCNSGGRPYVKWNNARTPHTRKKYAKPFLKQIETLKK